jgi:nucleoside-diphosphate-sugar epimerase
MKIVITGASGFVGSNLIEFLNESIEIVKISLRSNSPILPDYFCDSIIHLTGKAHDLKKVSNTNEYYEVNYELTKQLFDSFLLSDTKTFVYVSSVKAVSDGQIDVLTEIKIPNPQTHYGKSKLLAENYILSKELPPWKRVFILRPCMIHGPRNKGNLNLLYKLVSKGIPWPLGSYENLRSFCSIENLCFVINEILQNENIPSGIYNISDDQPISTNRLIELIAVSIDNKSRILKIPKGVISSIAKLGDFFCLPLNSENLQKLTESYVVSNKKIVNAIGKSLPVKTEEGLFLTFKSFR